MCDNQTNRSRGISDNTAFTAACSVLQTMSVSSSRRYRNTRDSNSSLQKPQISIGLFWLLTEQLCAASERLSY
ncbi:hypothetical protein C0J52_16481 [Blattella germanica]|nr:hypothetical protein C0J52_16481 [Blattella germanica]